VELQCSKCDHIWTKVNGGYGPLLINCPECDFENKIIVDDPDAPMDKLAAVGALQRSGTQLKDVQVISVPKRRVPHGDIQPILGR